MGKHRTPYPAEFRAQMVELVKAGRRPEELEKEFEPTAQTIYNWVAQADRDTGVRHDGLTTTLATKYSTIGIEDLNVAGMLRNGSLARSIADAGFGEFRRQLEYKAAMTGAQVIVIDRFYPSSNTCSSCGMIHAITLSDRVMDCACGLKMDRDLNAAINIRRQALALQSAERKALAGASAPVKPASMKQKKPDLDRNVQKA